MENKKGKNKTKQTKTSKFARSAISLFDQIMSVTRLYIVLVFGEGADWKNERVYVFQCTLQGRGGGGVLAQQTSPEKENSNLRDQIQFWKQAPT